MKGFSWYFKIYNFISEERLRQDDIDPRRIHAHLVVVLSTGILMWSYALLASLYISSPIPGIVGFICAAVHLLSPLLFRFTSKDFLLTNILISTGIVHQGTYSYFTGGFNSFMLIWFGILPMLAGLISGRNAVVLWATVATLWAGSYLFLDLYGFQFPDLITSHGKLLSRILIVFGWIFLSTSITCVILNLNESKERLLSSQSKKIEDLFRVLFHDLAGPLSRSSVGLSIAKRESNADDRNQGIEIASTAIDSMMDITQNIREMYTIYKEQVETKLVYYSLNEAVKNIVTLYETPLKEKQLQLVFDFKRHEGLQVLVEPVSFQNQVLGNAITNAIKFSKPSSKVTIHAYPLDEKIVAIEIVDEGIGMPIAILDSLFKMNKKTSRPGTLGEPGTGHGMHIMKSFMDLYKGDIQVLSKDDSQNECGTIVKLLLSGKWPGERTLPGQ